MWACIHILKILILFLVAKGERHDFQKKSWLLHACLLSFNSGKLKPFIWDFEDVFRLPCKLNACFKAHMRFVDLYCLGNCWESLLAVWRWMHKEVQITPLIFFFHQNRVVGLVFFFCFPADRPELLLLYPFLFSPLPSWFLFLFKALVSKNTGVSKWRLQLQWH